MLDDPEFHSLFEDLSLGGDLVDVIRRYQKCLAQDDLDLPEPFILEDILDKWGNRQGSPLPPVVHEKKAESKPAGAEKSAEKPAEKAADKLDDKPTDEPVERLERNIADRQRIAGEGGVRAQRQLGQRPAPNSGKANTKIAGWEGAR